MAASSRRRGVTFDLLSPPLRELPEAVAENQQLGHLFCRLNAETVNPDVLFPPGALDRTSVDFCV